MVNYESTGLIQVMKMHMETVHSTSAAPPARTEKAEDINKSCIPKIDKGLHEMSREEWRVWLYLWVWWRSLQPTQLDLTSVLMGRFPKISTELVSICGNKAYDEESSLPSRSLQ